MESVENYLKKYGLKLNTTGFSYNINEFRKYLSDNGIKSRIGIIQEFYLLGLISIEDWKLYFEPSRDITEGTEEEISYIVSSQQFATRKGGGFVVVRTRGLEAKKILKEKQNGVNELLKGWELESMFLDEKMIVDAFNTRISERISDIVNNSELIKEMLDGLPCIIMGEEMEI